MKSRAEDALRSDDPFEGVLRRHLGPDSVQGPPVGLRNAILAQARVQVRIENRPAWRLALPPAIGLGLLGLALGLLFNGRIQGAVRQLSQVIQSAGETRVPPPADSISPLHVLLQSPIWMQLFSSNLLIVVLPLLLLPLLYFLQDEGTRG